MSEGKIASDKALRELLKTGAYSDLTIKCGKYTFHVHKNIICMRSEYFATACKSGTFREGRSGVVDLHAARDDGDGDEDVAADDPEAVKLMIGFLYNHEYEAPAVFIDPDEANEGKHSNSQPRLTPCGDCNVVVHAKMYALGSKYQIDSLKAVALGKFTEAVMYAWNSADFVRATLLVYTTTPDNDKALRSVVSQAILDHKDILCCNPEMETTVCSINGLAFDLFKGYQSKKPDVEGPSCNICGTADMKQCNGCYQTLVSCSCKPKHSSGYWYCAQCKQRGIAPTWY